MRTSWALALALGTVVVWNGVAAICLPHPLGDEMFHYPTVKALLHGEPPPRALPMPLTFHWLAGWPLRLFGEELWVARLFVAALGVLLILVFLALLRAEQRESAGARLLLLAWNPLLLPYFALVYTDLASLLAIVTTLYFQVQRRYWLAAGALLAACLLRQSNVIWAAFVAAWGVLRAGTETDLGFWVSDSGLGVEGAHRRTSWCGGGALWSRLGSALRELRRCGAEQRAWLPLVVAAVGVGVLQWRGSLVMAPIFENRPAFNIAQFYLFFLVMALVWLPLWGREIVRNWSSRYGPALLRPWPCAAAVTLVTALIIGYANPHLWNQELEFLHNWPLRIMQEWLVARLLAACVLLAFFVVWARRTWQSSARAMLILTWAFAVLFLAPHYPVDTRYYIVPLVLLDLLTPYRREELRRLCIWYLVLTAGAGLFVACRPGPYGGL